MQRAEAASYARPFFESSRMSVDRPHFAFWPKRLPHSITVPATSLWHNVATAAARYPDRPAMVFFDRVTPYR